MPIDGWSPRAPVAGVHRRRACRQGRPHGRGRRLCAAVVATLLVAACGGGSGVAETPDATAGVDVGAAWQSYRSGGRSFTFRNASALVPAFTRVFTSLPSVLFAPDGGRYPQLRTQDGAAALDLYTAADGAVVGLVDLTSGIGESCYLAESRTALPAQAAIGSTGHIATLVGVNGCAPGAATLPVQLRLDWRLTTDESAPGLRFFCIRQSAFVRGSATDVVETCIESSAAGVLGPVARFQDQDGMFWWAR